MSVVAAPNPLREGLVEERVPDPCTLVIFGASGDLTRRKLVPALYSLGHERLLPSRLAIVGVARRPIGDDGFRAQMREGCDQFARQRPVDEDLWQMLASRLFYQQGNFDDPEAYGALRERLEGIEATLGLSGNRMFYLATAPSYYPTVIPQLAAAGLTRAESPRFARVIIEKPFGQDLESARALNGVVAQSLRERQVYRIDHYLGKETVQNILVFRFANGIFEPIWNQKYVDHVQLTVAESIGVEGRGGYFEEAGILRDMVQNHMLQFLALTAMEPPVAFEADAVRDEKVKVLRGLHEMSDAEVAAQVVRGQYTAGSVLGQRVPGYRDEEGVAKDSRTETFVAVRFCIDNWRWAGVPFYLRSGKRLPKRVSEIAIHFRAAPLPLFGGTGRWSVEPNVLAIRIQPDEGIALKFGSKVPGPTMEIHPVTMEFRYGTSFGREPPDAYERLILDCMLGDATLFTRADEVEAAWAWVSRIHEAWGRGGGQLASYEAGSWGPPEAESLLTADGRRWRRP